MSEGNWKGRTIVDVFYYPANRAGQIRVISNSNAQLLGRVGRLGLKPWSGAANLELPKPVAPLASTRCADHAHLASVPGNGQTVRPSGMFFGKSQPINANRIKREYFESIFNP
jgi:hypothetical protein